MPKPRPLTPDEARATLAHRLAGRVDRFRQLNTRFGIRPYRVFLVWKKWSGVERGAGKEQEMFRAEILPTPKVQTIDAISLRLYAAGVLPDGSVRVSEISATYTRDQLRGLVYPDPAYHPAPQGAEFAASCVGCGGSCSGPCAAPREPIPVHADHIKQPWEFFWEVVEDGRGDELPHRAKFRLASEPGRSAERVQWNAVLERVSEDDDRNGRSRIGPDP